MRNYSLRFLIRSSVNNINKGLIYCRISVGSVRKEFSLKREVDISKWDQRLGYVKGSSQQAIDINSYIDKIKFDAAAVHKEILDNKKPFNADILKGRILGTINEEPTLVELLKDFFELFTSKLEEGSLKNYRTTDRYLKEFLVTKLKTDDIRLTSIDFNFIAQFETFLLKRKPDPKQRPCSNNTVIKHIDRLNRILGLALKKQWLIVNPCSFYEKSIIKREHMCLNAKELAELENTDFNNEQLNTIRDLFVFSCYTGLAYMEIKALTSSHLEYDTENDQWLKIVRKKTKRYSEKRMSILILPQATKIITRYNSHPKCLRKNICLPVPSNQVYNRSLKKIAEFMGLEFPLTTHIARHTFATTVTLNNDVPIETVSDMLGHKSIRTTQSYSKVKEMKIKRDMKSLQKKFEANKQPVLKILR